MITVQDTLTESYSDQWQCTDSMQESPALVQWLASNDLIFVVLGVSLIIWFVLLFYLIRLDKKVGHLENRLEQNESAAEGQKVAEKSEISHTE